MVKGNSKEMGKGFKKWPTLENS